MEDSKSFQWLFWIQFNVLDKEENQVSLTIFWNTSDAGMEEDNFKPVQHPLEYYLWVDFGQGHSSAIQFMIDFWCISSQGHKI